MTQPPTLPFKSPEDKDRVGTSLRIPRALKTNLEKLAKERGLSLSDVCVHFLLWAWREWQKVDAGQR